MPQRWTLRRRGGQTITTALREATILAVAKDTSREAPEAIFEALCDEQLRYEFRAGEPYAAGFHGR